MVSSPRTFFGKSKTHWLSQNTKNYFFCLCLNGHKSFQWHRPHSSYVVHPVLFNPPKMCSHNTLLPQYRSVILPVLSTLWRLHLCCTQVLPTTRSPLLRTSTISSTTTISPTATVVGNFYIPLLLQKLTTYTHYDIYVKPIEHGW